MDFVETAGHETVSTSVEPVALAHCFDWKTPDEAPLWGQSQPCNRPDVSGPDVPSPPETHSAAWNCWSASAAFSTAASRLAG
jgi:hypothetical protein